MRDATDHLGAKLQLIPQVLPHVLANELSPERGPTGPAHPLDGPTILEVTGPGERPPEPHAPAREQRLRRSLIGLEDHLRGLGPRSRAHVAVEIGRGSRHLANKRRLCHDTREHRLLDRSAARDEAGLSHKDLREAVRVSGVVRPPVPPPGEVVEERAVHAGPETNDGHRDAVTKHRVDDVAHAPRLVGLPLTVREENHVSGERSGDRKILRSSVERRKDRGPAPRSHPSKLVLDPDAVPRRLHPNDTIGVGVERDHLEQVVGAERPRRSERSRLSKQKGRALHRPRTIDDQRERNRGLILTPLGLQPDGQEPLDVGSLPRTQPKRTRAPGHHEAAAEVPHIPNERVTTTCGHALGSDVREHDEIKSLELSKSLGSLPRAPRLDLEVPTRERRTKVLRVRDVAFDIQHRRRAWNLSRRRDAVVLSESVRPARGHRQRVRDIPGHPHDRAELKLAIAGSQFDGAPRIQTVRTLSLHQGNVHRNTSTREERRTHIKGLIDPNTLGQSKLDGGNLGGRWRPRWNNRNSRIEARCA